MQGLVVGALASILTACASTVGTSFPAESVDEIRIGDTRTEEIRELFGPPWQVGIEDGQVAWTYSFYHHPAIGRVEGRDLVVLFDDSGHVTSYRFQTTVGDEHEP